MEFLPGEVEKRYGFDTAATFLWREARARAAEQARLVQMEQVQHVVRDFPAIREALKVTQPARVQGRFAPPYGWNSAYAAKMATDGHLDYSEEAYRLAMTCSSAYQVHMAIAGRG